MDTKNNGTNNSPARGPEYTAGLTVLGAGERNQPTDKFEIFPNPHPNTAYHIRIESPEFTTLCPVTGQPDFATIVLEYVPGPRCVELKSYKLYLWHFRDECTFHEEVINQMLNDLSGALDPRWMRVSGVFNVRGGLYTSVVVENGDKALATPYPNLHYKNW